MRGVIAEINVVFAIYSGNRMGLAQFCSFQILVSVKSRIVQNNQVQIYNIVSIMAQQIPSTITTTTQFLSILNTSTDPDILQNFIDYAQLCSDPLEVFSYMQKKGICTKSPTYWIEKARYYCRMGEFGKAVSELTEAQERMKGENDYDGFLRETGEKMAEIEGQVEEVIRKKGVRRRSIEMYQALNGEGYSNVSNQRIKSRLRKLLDVYEKECKEEKKILNDQFQSSLKDKPRCSLSNGLGSFNMKIKRTHSILHKTFSFVMNKAQNQSPPKQKPPQFFRKQTLDSVQMAKKKKTRPGTDNKKELLDSLLAQDSRMYKTTSILEAKKVHFGNSAMTEQRIEKFRSIDFDHLKGEEVFGTIESREELERNMKSLEDPKSSKSEEPTLQKQEQRKAQIN